MKRKILRALKTRLSKPIYVTEFRDPYSNRIAVVDHNPMTKDWTVTYKRFIVKRNTYETKRIETYLGMDISLMVADIKQFVDV